VSGLINLKPTAGTQFGIFEVEMKKMEPKNLIATNCTNSNSCQTQNTSKDCSKCGIFKPESISSGAKS